MPAEAPAWEPAEAAAQLFTVKAGGLFWALPAHTVQTVFRIQSITTVPLASPVIHGLVNLRGRVVVAVDLEGRVLDRPPSHPLNPGALAVAVECGSDVFALVVEDVGDVLAISDADRVDLPPHLSANLARITSAWFRTTSGLLPVLDTDCLLDLEADRRSGLERRVKSPFSTGAKP